MTPIHCENCGLTMPVPPGGRRLCGCGSWLYAPAAGEEPVTAEVVAEPESSYPRLEGDLASIDRLKDGARRIQDECAKVIVGQNEVLEQLLISLFAQGHCLLVGVPGLAKTLMIRTMADSMNLTFSRIQFTPDLMPSDITGTEVLQEDRATGQRMFKFLHGPLFANVVLADEINRTPPKTQAALLEAMQERQVSVGGTRHRLPDPIIVRATQYLVLGAKARAVLHGRYYVSCEDIRAVAAPVLRHRIITNYSAEAEGIKPDDLVHRLADLIPRDPAESVAHSS